MTNIFKMTAREASDEGLKRMSLHTRWARKEIGKAKKIARLMGDECADELTVVEEQIGRIPVSSVFRGIRRSPDPPDELRRMLLSDMGLWERFFGRVGVFRWWRYRLRYARRPAYMR